LSLITFGFNKKNPDVSSFITVADTNDNNFIRTYGFKYNTDYQEGVFDTLWSVINSGYKKKYGYNVFFKKEWTGLSFTGPLALKFLKNESADDVGRTFVAIITDGEYNNISDPNNEIAVVGKASTPDSLKNKDLILSAYDAIRKTFLWNKITERELSNYKILLFEYIPLLSSFSIESLCVFNHKEILFRRIPSGYKSQFPISFYSDNSLFSIDQIKFSLIDRDNGLLKSARIDSIHGNLNVEFVITKEEAGRLKANKGKLKLNFWVNYNDPAYGVHMLDPFGSEIQGSNGLNREVKVAFEPNKKILYVIPLYDHLYKVSSWLVGNDQNRNIGFWNTLFTMLLIVLFFLLFIRYIKKHRRDSDVSTLQFDSEIIKY